jgi:hypothetical protein
MIINEQEAVARLNSPTNLINKLKNMTGAKRQSAMQLFGVGREKKEFLPALPAPFNPFQVQPQEAINLPVPTPTNLPDTTLDNILENHDSQIKLGLAHDNALVLLNNSVKMLADKLDDVKADKLPAVISAASKTVESIRKERSEASKNNKDREVHYHFYTPEQRKVSDYEVVEVQ